MKWTGAAIVTVASAIVACEGPDRPGATIPATDDVASMLSTDCTGLVPAAVPPAFSTTVLLGDACGPLGATTDGTANYTVGKTCGNGFDSWQLLDGSGANRANGPAYRTALDDANERAERHVLGQPAGGFLAFNWVTDGNSSASFHRVVSLQAYSGDGVKTGEHFFINLTRTSVESFPDRSWSLAPLPSGGAQVSHVSLPGDGTWHLSTQRLSSSATPLDGVQQLATASNSSVPQHVLTGVAMGGQALIAWDNGTEGRAAWTDAAGHLLGGSFSLPFRVDGNTTVSPLLDGTLAFNQVDQWIGAIAPGSHTVAAAPSWLSTRPGSHLFVIRGGRGHGLFTQPPQGSCQAHLVVFAPAGNRCGAIDLPSGDADGCASSAEIGRDGTVIVQGHTSLVDNGSIPEERVTERFYPQLVQ